jgi:hypothetical protein
MASSQQILSVMIKKLTLHIGNKQPTTRLAEYAYDTVWAIK